MYWQYDSIEINVLLYRVVGDVLGNLKGMAQEMGSELDRQNKQIDRLDKKAQIHDIHLKQANQRIRQQLWTYPTLLHYIW